jgi:hypothetical protein
VALFDYATLKGASFLGTSVAGASFEKADLNLAKFENTDVSRADFQNAKNIESVSFKNACWWAWKAAWPYGRCDVKSSLTLLSLGDPTHAAAGLSGRWGRAIQRLRWTDTLVASPPCLL